MKLYLLTSLGNDFNIAHNKSLELLNKNITTLSGNTASLILTDTLKA